MQQLNQQITATMAKLKISKSELSRRLGKSRGYLAEMQKIGCSTEKQAELIAKIQRIGEGQVYKTEADVIHELGGKLKDAHGWIEHNHRIAEERAEHILKLKSINDTIDTQIEELCETTRKQDGKIAFLNVTLGQANKNAEYQLSRVPTTAMAAFILFIKMIFGGRA